MRSSNQTARKEPEPQGYGVRVRCVHVPGVLYGVPITTEVVFPSGASQRDNQVLGESTATVVKVPGPGLYLVRTRLPSGEIINTTATVPEKLTDSKNDMVTGEASLNFGAERPPDAESGRLRIAEQMRTKHVPSRFSATGRVSESVSLMSDGGINSDPAAPERVDVLYGTFQKWEATRDNETGKKQYTLVLEEPSFAHPESIRLPGEISPPEREDDPGEPLLMVWARQSSSNEAEQSSNTITVWPPGCLSLTLLPSQNRSENSSVSPLLALAEIRDRNIDALFSYVRGNALDTARDITEDTIERGIIRRAESLLLDKRENPLFATLAGYVLLKLGSNEREDWIQNLANWFPNMPDGAILYGWFRINLGHAEEAGAWFHRALQNGVPMYSEGVRLLQDGLNFLFGLYPGDAQIRQDAEWVRQLASIANLDSELTSLRVSAAFRVRFTSLSPADPERLRTLNNQLGWTASSPSRTALAEALSDDDSDIRISAIDALARIGTVAETPALVKALSDEESYIRRNAAEILGKIGDASVIPPLIQTMQDTDVDVRRSTVNALSRIGNALAIPALAAALSDADLGVRNMVIVALGEIGDISAVPVLTSVLNDVSDTIRLTTVQALDKIKDPSAIAALVQALSDKDKWVHLRAAEALAANGQASGVAALVQALSDKDIGIRRMVMYFFTNQASVTVLNEASTVAALIQALSDEDLTVRRIAGGILAKIGKP